MSRRKLFAAMAAAVVGGLGFSANAAALIPGDVVIYRVGDGAGALVNTGSAVFLDEYSPTGTLDASIAMPTVASGANVPLIASGVATSEGFLTVSPNGQYVSLTGYDRTLGGSGSLSATTGTAVPRVIGIVNAATGAVDTSTALTNYSSGNNPRSAVTTDGNTIYAGGGAGGVIQTTLGSTGTSSTQFSATGSGNTTNLRQINIFGGSLFASTSSGSTFRVGQLATGTAPTSFANLPGLPNTGTATTPIDSPYGFFFATLNPASTSPDTLYIADDFGAASTTVGGIEKYSLVSGNWVASGSPISAANVRGLTGTVLPSGGVELFATTGGSGATGGGTLWSLSDGSGFNGSIDGTLTQLATAANNEAFRGVAIIPVPEPTGLALLAISGVTLLGRRRRVQK